MKRLFLHSLIFSFSLCSALSAQQSISGSFTSGGETRSYIGAVPDSPQNPLRLVILFCGATENAAQMELRGFNDFLGSNSMVIYPEPSSPVGFDNVNGVDDFQMVEDLINTIDSIYTIDTNDICIGGFSNGGIFTYKLACDFNSPNSNRPYTFKAIAVVSGAMESGTTNSTECPISNNLPLIAFHGTQDPVIQYNGGQVQPPVNILAESTETTVDFWAISNNDCTGNPTVTSLPDLVTETPTSSTVELLEYQCSSSPNTHFYRIEGGMHAWPSGNAQLDIFQGRNLDVNASELIAAFFESSTTTSTSETILDPNSVSVYPNPVKDLLSIQTAYSVEQIEIFSITGQRVFAVTQPNLPISLSDLRPGIYLLKIKTDAGMDVKKIIKE